MSRRVSLDVVRADAFVDVVGRLVARTEPVVEDHATALRRYLAAPNDLAIAHPELAGPAADELRREQRLVAATARFAALLREADVTGLTAVDEADEARWHAEVTDALDVHWWERLRERADDVLTWHGRISWIDGVADDVAGYLETTVARVRSTLRRSTVVLDEVLDGVVRRTVVELRELEHLVELRPAVDASWLRRIGSATDWLGPAGDAVAGVFAGWEQWDEDEHRDDLTSTERVLRTGSDVAVRGGAQLAVGAATTAAAAPFVVAAPATFGASLVVAGAIAVAGVGVGEAVDGGVDALLDRAYEAEWFGRSADWLDGRGRELRDTAVGVGQWSGEQLDQLRELPGVAERAWDVGLDAGRRGFEDAADGAADIAADLGRHLGGLAGALPWP